MSLEKRLAALEAVSAGRHRDDPRQIAMGRLLIALREALPDDPYKLSSSGVAYPPGHQWHMEKVRALSDRIARGTDTDEDRILLDTLPQDACLDMTASEFVTMIAGIEFFY